MRDALLPQLLKPILGDLCLHVFALRFAVFAMLLQDNSAGGTPQLSVISPRAARKRRRLVSEGQGGRGQHKGVCGGEGSQEIMHG